MTIITAAGHHGRVAALATATVHGVARQFPAAHEGHRQRSDAGMEWEVRVPAARGMYVGTVCVLDPRSSLDEGEAPAAEYDHREVSVTVTGAWASTETAFQLPGGFSSIPDIGEPVTVQPQLLAAHIVDLITQFETNVPGLALGAAQPLP